MIAKHTFQLLVLLAAILQVSHHPIPSCNSFDKQGLASIDTAVAACSV